MNAEKFKFRTEVSIERFPFTINHKTNVFLAGSCFADMIGTKMAFNKFNCISNPYGNIYNPYSLFSLLRNSLTDQEPDKLSYIENQGSWFNYNFHSEISGKTIDELKTSISSINQKTGEFLRKTDFLILTFGTAYVYKLIEGNNIVANCHKIPSRFFKKELLSTKEIIDEFEKLQKELLRIRPDLKVILTVSPVRHLKDTLTLNNVSKSILRTAVHYIVESFPNVFYFPSYEIMMDDLRDYRFYKDDLIHPTEFAEEYIWDKFSTSCIDKDTLVLIKEWEKVSRAINHRAFHPDSAAHQNFLKETYLRLESLNKKADFSEEMRSLKEKII